MMPQHDLWLKQTPRTSQNMFIRVLFIFPSVLCLRAVQTKIFKNVQFPTTTLTSHNIFMSSLAADCSSDIERRRDRGVWGERSRPGTSWLALPLAAHESRLIARSLFRVLLSVVLGILHELLLVLAVFLGEVGAQRVLGLGVIDQRHQSLDHLVCLGCGLPVFG